MFWSFKWWPVWKFKKVLKSVWLLVLHSPNFGTKGLLNSFMATKWFNGSIVTNLQFVSLAALDNLKSKSNDFWLLAYLMKRLISATYANLKFISVIYILASAEMGKVGIWLSNFFERQILILSLCQIWLWLWFQIIGDAHRAKKKKKRKKAVTLTRKYR